MGKTQLFPSVESDFFRNRLTHSIEVAQVAKSIANKLNFEEQFFSGRQIDTDLVELAALAHDLGHPPFGHNGEEALDERMAANGGFEGNAQTLRILSTLEKKAATIGDGYGVGGDGEDGRYGLNLTARSLAAVLKYDRPIPMRRNKTRKGKWEVKKGYYASEARLVEWIKRNIDVSKVGGEIKTIECHIMDISDDIAYSTYDLEDAFKAGFIKPMDIVAMNNPELDRIVSQLREKAKITVTREEIRQAMFRPFEFALESPAIRKALSANSADLDYNLVIKLIADFFRRSEEIANSGYLRTKLTSELVGRFIGAIEFVPNEQYPQLSEVRIKDDFRLEVEILKRIAFNSQITSPKLQVVKLRGKEIVAQLFDILSKRDNHKLMPEDYQRWYTRLKSKPDKMRVICDFIAGMTDRYAVEFYCRLTAETPQSIFKPF